MTTVEALLFEREGYLRRGLRDRVAQVDRELARLGFHVTDDDLPETAVPGDPERAVRNTRRPRR